MRVLLVEDDRATWARIELAMRGQGYICDSTSLGEDAIELATHYEHDIIILDVMLPDMDGFEVTRRLRDSKVMTPILILSGLIDLDTKIKVLSYGADDFLTKPFEDRELVARIQAIVRRARGHAHSVIRTGRLSVNLATRAVEFDGKPLHLTVKEYVILELLSLRKGNTVSKETLMNHLYGGLDEPDLHIIDVFVCKLRKKLVAAGGAGYIHTEWGFGYALREPASEAKPRGAVIHAIAASRASDAASHAAAGNGVKQDETAGRRAALRRGGPGTAAA